MPKTETNKRWHGLEYEDKWDKDPARRYKCVIWPFTRDISEEGGIEGGPGLIACSPDGIDWTADMRHQWFRTAMGSDTSNNIFYNPITQEGMISPSTIRPASMVRSGSRSATAIEIRFPDTPLTTAFLSLETRYSALSGGRSTALWRIYP